MIFAKINIFIDDCLFTNDSVSHVKALLLTFVTLWEFPDGKVLAARLSKL